MGADLFITSINDANEAKHKPAFLAAVEVRDAFTKLYADRVFAQTEFGPKIYEAQRAVENAATDEQQKQYEVLQAEVGKHYALMNADDGYFRDSYNDSSVAWVLGFSWWSDVIPMLDQSGHLPIDKAKKLLAMVESKAVTHEAIADKYPEEPREKVAEYYEGKKRRLIEFLKRSIEMGEPILCSL